MKRNLAWAVTTVAGTVALFTYPTSWGQSITSSAASAVTSSSSSGSSDDGTSSGSSDDGTSSSDSSSSSSSSSSSGSSSSKSKTYTGDAVNTRWGIVQVQITVKNGKITKSEAVQYPSENPKDQEINAYALPILNQEAVGSTTGSIDAVSGATVTSDGYITSLQSAIDQAGI